MKGLLYKEFRQNLPSYITSFAIIPFMILLYTFTFSFIEGKYESLEHGLKIIYSSEGYFILILTYVMGFLVADTISSKTLTNDEFKKWAYFISSTPALPKGQVIVKYISSFIISMICMISLFLTDTFMSMAVKKYEIEMLFDAKKLFIALLISCPTLPCGRMPATFERSEKVLHRAFSPSRNTTVFQKASLPGWDTGHTICPIR